MALTREFKQTVVERAQADTEFRRAMLEEAVNQLLGGDVAMGKRLLRDTVNATIGFTVLGTELGKSPKSLMRMLSEDGNPRAENLFAILAALQAREGVRLEARAA